MNPRERAERAVVHDVRIRDRQHHARVMDVRLLENILQVHDARLGVHAVIGGDSNDEPILEEL